MEGLTWPDLLDSLIIPALLLIGGLIGGLVVWTYRQSLERKMRLEQDLRGDRVDLYYQIIEPFVLLLTSSDAWTKDNGKMAMSMLASVAYRTAAFKLRLVANDNVLRTYDRLMEYFAQASADAAEGVSQGRRETTIDRLGGFLLAIRKSIGNEATEMTRPEMVEWILSHDAVVNQKARESPQVG